MKKRTIDITSSILLEDIADEKLIKGEIECLPKRK